MTKLRKQNNSVTLNNTFQALLARVRTALGQIIPDQSEVDSLRDSIESQILVPSWFRFSTQLCYNWYPDGDAGQCGGMCPSVCPSVCPSGCTQGTLYTTTTVYGVLVHQEGAICTTQAQYAPWCTRETMFFEKFRGP